MSTNSHASNDNSSNTGPINARLRDALTAAISQRLGGAISRFAANSHMHEAFKVLKRRDLTDTGLRTLFPREWKYDKTLLKIGAIKTGGHGHKYTLLHYACKHRRINAIRFFVLAGANAESEAIDDWTIWHIVGSYYYNTPVPLPMGPEPAVTKLEGRARTRQGWEMAVLNGNIGALNYLMSRNPDLDLSKVARCAIRINKPEIIMWLLSHTIGFHDGPATVGSQKEGFSLVEYAAIRANEVMLRLLLSIGGNATLCKVVRRKGITAMQKLKMCLGKQSAQYKRIKQMVMLYSDSQLHQLCAQHQPASATPGLSPTGLEK